MKPALRSVRFMLPLIGLANFREMFACPRGPPLGRLGQWRYNLLASVRTGHRWQKLVRITG